MRRFAVGEPIVFQGYADDYGQGVTEVQFSLDNGKTWTSYPTSEAESDKWVNWRFVYTPEKEGRYRLKVRSKNEAGAVSPTAAVVDFEVEP